MPPVDALNRLRTARWLASPALARVFSALASTGAVSRVVGGAVRNTLLGVAVDDIDIATAATPHAVVAAAKSARIAAIPTGLQHGTVTLVADGTPFEVTTLRRDVATDGRHATVAFTDDWAEDARRRDFTINALYADADGTLFDPLGGAADLEPVRIRFIGDARARIREDYLRILRFFRFAARFGDGPLDAAGLAACDAERAGLSRVSVERIRVELLKLLVCPRAAEVCRVMQAHGFLVGLLGAAPAPGRLQRLAAIEAATGEAPDAVVRLATLALTPFGDAAALARRLKLSGRERSRLQTIATDMAALAAHRTPAADHHALYRRDPDGFRDGLLAAWAASSDATDDAVWRGRLGAATEWSVPALPVTGQDVMALGVPGGPAVGRLLATVEAWWIERDFVPDRAACLDDLARRVRDLD